MGLACRRGRVRHDTGTFSVKPQSGRHMNIASRNSTHPDIARRCAVPACVRERGAVLGHGEPADARRPAHMPQIYDRVLSSRSVPTLIALSVSGRCLCLPGRSRFDPLAGGAVCGGADQRLALAVHNAVIRLSVTSRHPGDGPSRSATRCPRLSDRGGPDRHCRSTVGPDIPDHLFLIHPWLGWRRRSAP
jgi:hypothetical protein